MAGPGLFTLARRRTLLAAAAALTGTSGNRAAAVAATARDHALIAGCAAFNAIEARRLALFDGPARVDDDDARLQRLKPLMEEQMQTLDAICDNRASTRAGHKARALSFLLWDAGELEHRAAANGFLEDRLLAAILRDLTDGA